MRKPLNFDPDQPNIILTGGTGFLGQHLLPLLQKISNVFVLSRSGQTELNGDLTRWNLGLANIDQELLDFDFKGWIHLGGLYDLRENEVTCMQTNVMGLGTSLKMAEYLHIPTFINASTVAVAINNPRLKVFPNDLIFEKEFPDAYAKSKAHGEQLFIHWPKNNIKNSINLRLGVLVGDTQEGRIQRIDGPYHLIRVLNLLRDQIESWPLPLLVPGQESQNLPLLPVDKAASAILRILELAFSNQITGFQSFHLTPPKGVNVKMLYEKIISHFNIKIKNPRLVFSKHFSNPAMGAVIEKLLQLPREELYYLLHFPQYDSSSTQQLLGSDWCPEFTDYENPFWRGYEKFMENC